MKEQYIAQVKRRLLLPREMADRVQADLEEIFAEAAAQGESEAQTAARLGPPRQFAAEVMADLGPDAFAADRHRRAARAGVLTALFLGSLLLQLVSTPLLAALATDTSAARLPLPALLDFLLVPPLLFGLGGPALLSLLAVKRDIRLRDRRVRLLLAAGSALLIALLLGVEGAVLFRPQLYSGPLGHTTPLYWAAEFIAGYPLLFLPLGAGLFCGLNRR